MGTTKTMSEVDGKITAVKQRTEKITSSTDLMLDDFPPPQQQQQQPMLPPTSLRHVSDAYLVQYPPSELSSTKSNVGSNKSYKSNASTVRGGSGGSDDRSSNCSEKTTDQLNEYDLPPGTKFGFDDQLDRMSVGSRQSSASSRAKIRSNLHSGFDDNLNREVLDRTDQLDDELERMSLGGMSSRKMSSKQNSSRLHDRFDERLGGLTHYGLNNNRGGGLLGFQNSFWGGEEDEEVEDSFFSKAFRDDFFKDTTRLMRRNNLLGGVDNSSRGLRAQKQQQLQVEQQQVEAQQLHVQQQKLEVQKLEEQQLQIQQQQLQQLQQLQIEQQQLEKLQKKQRMMRDKETADYEDSGIFSETSSIQTDRSLLDSVHSEKNSKQQQQQQQQLKQLQEKQLQVQQQQQPQIKQQQLEKLQKSQRMMSNKEDYEDCGISSETSSIQTDRSPLDSGHSEKNSKQ